MNTYLKYFLIGFGVVIGILILVNIFTPKVVLTEDIKDLEKKIEGLQANNLELIKKQIEMDSLAVEYQSRIEIIENRLVDVSTSRVIIQKIYTDKIKDAQDDTPSQVDSFFKSRYKY
jgi:hypothetical protein